MEHNTEYMTWFSEIEYFAKIVGVPVHPYRLENAYGESLKAVANRALNGHNGAMQLLRSFATMDDLKRLSSMTIINAEIEWDKFGRPYFKITDGMCECMKHCSIDIPTTSLKMPFNAIELRLPRGVFPVDQLSSSVIVRFVSREEALSRMDDTQKNLTADDDESFGRRFGVLSFSYQTKLDVSNRQHTQVSFILRESKTIDECVEAWRRLESTETDELSDDNVKLLVRIAVAACFFAVDNHPTVVSDVDRQDLERKYPRARGKRGRIADERIEAEIAGHRGWIVGKEISLPRRYSISNGEHGTGGKFTSGHVRSGHMRMQAHGTKLRERKLVFIAPTLVRPDLPMKPSSGFKI